MTSRFGSSYVCLNGPKEGYWIDAPPGVEEGNAVAMPWIDAKGLIRFAVYVLMAIPTPEGETAPDDAPKLGLVFIKSHETPERAQQHVTDFALVMGAAKYDAANDN
jgi:hypothetical protein